MEIKKSDVDKILRAFRAYRCGEQRLDDLRDAHKYCKKAVDGTDIWWGDLSDVCKLVVFLKKTNDDCYKILKILGIGVLEDAE